MGKMIDAQSIVVASVATSTTESGNGSAAHATTEPVSPADVLRYVFFHSLGLAILVGLLVLLQAYVFPGMVP